MRHTVKAIAAILVSLTLPVSHAAAQVLPMAEGLPCQVPELLKHWSKPSATIPSVFQRSVGDIGGAVLQHYSVSLSPCGATWCKPGTYASMVKLEFPAAGRYRIAVDAPLWIDLYTIDTMLDGVMCEHSGCQPLRKIVQFDVKAGSHWITLQGRNAETVGLIVAPVSSNL